MNDVARPSKEKVAQLRDLRVRLKSGEYTGTDVMQAWIVIGEYADAIERADNEPCVRPSAWYRGVRCAGSPSEPAEYDVEMSYGDDQPEGKGWLPLYRLPEGPTGDYRDQLYGLLVRRGWSQHEAQATAYGGGMPVSAQPPAECDGCEQYAVMHAEIALALDIHDETDAHGLQELILKKLRAAQPPGVLPDQSDVLAWAVRSFGPIAQNVDERAARIAEEAIEIAQVEGVPLDTIKRIADRVYSRPAGERWQEIGGTMIGILSYAEIVGLSMAECTRREFDRVLSKPREWWQKKHAEKVAAGTADLSPCSTATKSGEQP